MCLLQVAKLFRVDWLKGIPQHRRHVYIYTGINFRGFCSIFCVKQYWIFSVPRTFAIRIDETTFISNYNMYLKQWFLLMCNFLLDEWNCWFDEWLEIGISLAKLFENREVKQITKQVNLKTLICCGLSMASWRRAIQVQKKDSGGARWRRQILTRSARVQESGNPNFIFFNRNIQHISMMKQNTVRMGLGVQKKESTFVWGRVAWPPFLRLSF